LYEIPSPNFTANGLEAVTAPTPGIPSPYVELAAAGTDPNFSIDANTYHRLSFTLLYDHPELTSDILSNTWGGICRVIWNGGTGGLRVTKDIVSLNGLPNTFVMDLATLNTIGVNIEDQNGHPGPPWAGSVRNLWIRITEAAVPRWFRLSNVKLAADAVPND